MRRTLRGLRVQGRVIGALILREIGSRHGSETAHILWMLVEPILITIIVVGIHFVGAGSYVVQSTPVVVFLLTGYVPHLMFRHSGLAGVVALQSNNGLLYHQRVHFVDLVLARLAVEMIAVLLAFLIIYVAFYYFGLIQAPRIFAFVALGWFFHLWFIMIACFLFTGGCLIFPLLRRMFQPIVLLGLPAYCAFFMLAWLPSEYQYWILFFPSANATEIMRHGYFGAGASTFYNIPYTIEACLILTFLGLVVMFKGREHLEL